MTEPMDPKAQECFGLLLYGAGYYSRNENTLGLLTGGDAPPNFCLSCIKHDACEDEHERRVRDLDPEAAELFDRRMAEARRRNIPPTLAAVMLGKRGQDPYAREAIENFKLGHAHRGAQLGPLTK